MPESARPGPGPVELRNHLGERLAFSFTAGLSTPRPGDAPRPVAAARPVAAQATEGSGRDLVVIGHGVTSDKDRPWSEALAHGLAGAGIDSLRIAFAGNGESEGRFGDATISKEALDLGAVLDAFPGRRLHYIGHSMGGAVGLVRAAEDARIRTLVSLAAVTHTAEFVRRVFGQLEPGEPMLGKLHCPWDPALEADLVAIDSLAGRRPLDPIPWLIVHGTADQVVPPEHSRDLHAGARSGSELVELEGVDHSFTGPGLERLTGAVLPWLRAALAGRSAIAGESEQD